LEGEFQTVSRFKNLLGGAVSQEDLASGVCHQQADIHEVERLKPCHQQT
jgi:hypothetical protein